MNNKTKLLNIIKKSKLTNKEQNDFGKYLNSLRFDNLERMIKMFGNKSNELADFWLSLRTRIFLLQEIDTSNKIIEVEKEKIKKSIIDMNDEEFYACVYTMKIEANTTKVDLDRKIKNLLKAEKENHQKFVEISNNLLRGIFKKQAKKVKKNDEQRYENVLNKIKGLN